MKKNETLLDKAKINYNAAKHLYKLALDDEAYLNIVAYHLQQAVELTIKYVLESSGAEYPKTHDIEKLVSISLENNINLYLPDYIEDHQETFSAWEAKTRYVLNYSVEAKKIEKALPEVETYIQIIDKEFENDGILVSSN